ncbi:NAD-dependent epimerase/dehydratase family protein [archaeon]|jgi:nucleoside-diphosphate-sugar epimerase|nr:NAD-dependent epimerase/dehydratase family protein [archaeon]MBT3451158.1 NAD-dependent epimerase/dehydratase family protein [archaeon]MBT6869309.1 NAD-dependent epimerase/dehydratase family protein [archaeon]MBT7192472.1 NAD-dependent epimerase/dehydratase family protein [archaeon]MBT7380548.1 NAD-dependent epimerase/dehydratase family protein [archaeon]
MEHKTEPLTYFITGGSGFLGINLIRFLLDKGHKIKSFDLVDFDYPEKEQTKNVEIIKGDIRNFELLKESMKNVDIVIHCAAALPLYTEKEIYSTDINGTENVIKAAHENNVNRMIHISSTAVYGIPDHHPLFENDKLDGVGAYGISKIKAEKVCTDYREKGMCISIIRPKSFVGPERLGVFAIYYDWIRRGKNIPIVGWGKNRYQLLDVRDLCDAIYLCATKDKEIVNDTFNIGAKEYTTMKEDFGAVTDYAGFGKKIIGTPAKPLILVLRILEWLHLSPLYKWVYETAPEDSFVSIEKAEKQLSYAPKYSNKQALIDNYKWYLENYKEYENKTGVSHRVPWKQGILSIVRWFF